MNAIETAVGLITGRAWPRRITIQTVAAWLYVELGETPAALEITRAAIRVYCERRVTATLLGRSV